MTETATFAAGCFWGVEVDFRNTPGVTDVKVGYTGGHVDEPDYKTVCSGTTGHAEAVEVTFDPSEVSYDELVDQFWSKARAQTQLGRPIATEITPASTFWPAEEYHQQYLVKNGRATCRI